MQKYIKFLLGALFVLTIGLSGTFLLLRSNPIDMTAVIGKKNIEPILIIGSGCAGYSAAIYAARGKIKTAVLVGSQPGGQLGSTTRVENFPGLLDQLGPDIMLSLQKQAEHFGAEIIYDSAASIDCSVWPYKVITQSGKTINALTIIVAAGASPAKLGIPGEDEYWGKGVTTCAICDAPFHKDKDVVVVGGGDSALEEALQLSSYAKKVTILVRKDAMRASVAMQDRIKDVDSIEVLYNSEVKEIYGNGSEVTHVLIHNNKTNETFTKSVSGVFLAIGHKPNTTSLCNGQIKTDADGYIITSGKTQATSKPGIFAAGDIEDKIYRQAGVAAGSGIKAALDALGFLQNHGFNVKVAKQIEANYFDIKKPEIDSVPSKAILAVTSKEQFESLRNERAILIVDFYTTQCPACKYMLPALEQIASEMGDRTTFIKINANEIPALANEYKITSVPTLLVFKNGKLVKEQVGSLSYEALTEFLKDLA